MPRRNRVTPLGDIVAIEQRGAWTGNRGILHDGEQLVRNYAGDLWITCLLQFRGRWRAQWQPRHYTHLYFLDEAVSFAAGHRPCGECRHADYVAYRDAFPYTSRDSGPPATAMNRQLQRERLIAGTRRRRLHEVDWADVPDGAFVLLDGVPRVVMGAGLVAWTAEGYRGRRPRPSRGAVTMITPPSTAQILRRGYQAQLDPAIADEA